MFQTNSIERVFQFSVGYEFALVWSKIQAEKSPKQLKGYLQIDIAHLEFYKSKIFGPCIYRKIPA
jgi:hypothetical protein